MQHSSVLKRVEKLLNAMSILRSALLVFLKPYAVVAFERQGNRSRQPRQLSNFRQLRKPCRTRYRRTTWENIDGEPRRAGGYHRLLVEQLFEQANRYAYRVATGGKSCSFHGHGYVKLRDRRATVTSSNLHELHTLIATGASRSCTVDAPSVCSESFVHQDNTPAEQSLFFQALLLPSP